MATTTNAASLPRARAVAGRLGPRMLVLVAAAAVVARVATALVLWTVNDSYFVADEGQYVALADAVADGRGAESWFPGYGQQLYDSTWAFVAPIARIYDVVGTSRLPAQLWAALFGVLTALLTAALAGHLVRRRWALVAGLLVALLPSQVLWSSIVLRESLVWCALAAAALAFQRATAAATRPAAAWAWWAGVAGALGSLALLREQTLVLGCWALIAAALVARSARRVPSTVAGVGIGVLLPLVVGLGVGGLGLVRDNSSTLATTRTYLSLDAESALEDPVEVDDPRSTGTARRSGGEGRGWRYEDVVGNDGKVRRVIRARDGRVLEVERGAASDLRHLPTGLAATLLRPIPGESGSSSTADLARLENIVWYAVYVLALVGAVAVARARPPGAVFALAAVGAVTLGSALTQGNVGTAFRHRGQLWWGLALLTAIGLQHLADRRSRPTSDSGATPGAVAAAGGASSST